MWRQNFWLGLFSGAASPKPLMALSNSPLIQGLNLGAMTNEMKKRNNFVKTTCAFAELTTAQKPLRLVVLYPRYVVAWILFTPLMGCFSYPFYLRNLYKSGGFPFFLNFPRCLRRFCWSQTFCWQPKPLQHQVAGLA